MHQTRRVVIFSKFFSSFTGPENSAINKPQKLVRTTTSDKFNLYKVLGIRKTAALKHIKDAYYHLAKIYHPDANSGNPEAGKKFQQITEAYEILSDEVKRTEYDKFGTVSGISSVKTRVLTNVMRRSDYVLKNIFKDTVIRQGLTEIAENPDELFDKEISVTLTFPETMKGSRREILVPTKVKCEKCERGIFATANPDACKVCNGSGVQTIKTDDSELLITCKFCGGSKVQFRVPCPECDGKGHLIKRQKLAFDVPKFAKDGDTFQISHQSRRKPVVVRFKVDNSDNFSRDDRDIIIHVDLPLTKALLGGKLNVKTLNGYTQIDISPGIQHGARIRLPGQGIMLGGKQGDQICVFRIKIPSSLSERQRQLIHELDEELNLS